eukprot:9502138-Pyramimonas_sp.AAC.1
MLLRFSLAVASMLLVSLMVFLMKVKLRFSVEVEGMDLPLMVMCLYLAVVCFLLVKVWTVGVLVMF